VSLDDDELLRKYHRALELAVNWVYEIDPEKLDELQDAAGDLSPRELQILVQAATVLLTVADRNGRVAMMPAPWPFGDDHEFRS
jgi:hypothetical protein